MKIYRLQAGLNLRFEVHGFGALPAPHTDARRIDRRPLLPRHAHSSYLTPPRQEQHEVVAGAPPLKRDDFIFGVHGQYNIT